MKLSTYAREEGISYRTAWRWFKAGQIPGRQMPSGTIVVDTGARVVPHAHDPAVVVYARVSSAENRTNLQSQADRVTAYCAARGWKVTEVVKETGSGLNDRRPKLGRLLADPAVTVIVVEHKDRLTRFGFVYIEALLAQRGGRVEVINAAEGEREDLIQDFVNVITSFCARIYGQRRAKRRTEKLLAELQADP